MFLISWDNKNGVVEIGDPTPTIPFLQENGWMNERNGVATELQGTVVVGVAEQVQPSSSYYKCSIGKNEIFNIRA